MEISDYIQEGAYIADHTALMDLGNMLKTVGNSVLRIKEAADGYMADVERHIQRGMEVLEKRYEEAERHLQAAQHAYSSCLSSQRYDEESNSYKPSCSIEQRRVERAQKECTKIRSILDEVRRIQNDVEHELYLYRCTRGFLTPPGGGPLLEELGDDLTTSGTQCLSRILDKVEEYVRFDIRTGNRRNIEMEKDEVDGIVFDEHGISKEDRRLLDSDQLKQKQQESKADIFRSGIEKIEKRQERDNYAGATGYPGPPNAIVICSGCKRPVKVCTCQHERFRQEELPMFNYNFSKDR